MEQDRIVFAVVGSHGDLNPFIAVAVEMQRLGWPCLLLAASEYAEKARIAGLPFAPMRPGWGDVATHCGLDPAAFVHRLASDDGFMFREFLLPAVETSFADARPVVEGARLVVVNHLALGAQMAAEAAGAPVAVVALQPLILLSAHDPPSLGATHWLPLLRHALGWKATRMALRMGMAVIHPYGKRFAALRAKVGLPPVKAHWLTAGVRDAVATICLWSPLVGRLQPDHPPGTLVAGSLAYDDEPDIPDHAALAAFLGAGPPPMVLTLGSVVGRGPGRFYEDGIEAARRLGLRAVVVAGPHPPERVDGLAAPDVFVAGYARYSQVFSQAAIVVHHGGMGTCIQALRAGKPQVIAPLLSDQHDNARRVALQGAAKVVRFDRWTADAAEAACRALLTEPVRKRAAKLGRIVSLEDGAKAAAEGLALALGSRAPVPLPPSRPLDERDRQRLSA